MGKVKGGHTAHARKKRKKWYIHLLIFVMTQVVFLLLDGYSGWHLFHLNPFGEWAIPRLNAFVGWFQVYENQLFNIMTVGWGIILIIDGFVSLFFNIRPK